MKHAALLLSIVCLLVFVACGQGDKTEKAAEMVKPKVEPAAGMVKEKAKEAAKMAPKKME